MKPLLLALTLLLAACASTPSTKYDDIMAAYDARAAAIMESFKAGRITKAEAAAQEAEARSRAHTEIRMRRALDAY